jgi:hypothetical protein
VSCGDIRNEGIREFVTWCLGGKEEKLTTDFTDAVLSRVEGAGIQTSDGRRVTGNEIV